MTEFATIENVLNLYLYGSLDKPYYPASRIRDAVPGPTGLNRPGIVGGHLV